LPLNYVWMYLFLQKWEMHWIWITVLYCLLWAITSSSTSFIKQQFNAYATFWKKVIFSKLFWNQTFWHFSEFPTLLSLLFSFRSNSFVSTVISLNINHCIPWQWHALNYYLSLLLVSVEVLS
jgi:hypothetical protein